MTDSESTRAYAARQPMARYPVPTVPEPDELDELQRVIGDDENAETSDGCTVEPDGVCEHGHPSWLRRWGVI